MLTPIKFANALAILGLMLACPVAQAQNASDDAQQNRAHSKPQARVFIDPKIGERRLPSADEREQMRQYAQPQPQTMQVTHRDGMRFVHVPVDRRMQLQAEVNAQGQVRSYHGEEQSHD